VAEAKAEINVKETEQLLQFWRGSPLLEPKPEWLGVDMRKVTKLLLERKIRQERENQETGEGEQTGSTTKAFNKSAWD